MSDPTLPRRQAQPSAVLPPPPPASPLPAHRLNAGSSSTEVTSLRTTADVPYLKLSDAAVRAMTDFTRDPAFSVAEDERIDAALDEMFRHGVRALFTLRDGQVTGLITSYDIQGERPQQLLARSTDLRREDIRVLDVLTPWSELGLITFDAVQSARVSDVMERFDITACTHLVVIQGSQGSVEVRGLLSRTRLRRQLERPL